MTYQSRGAIKCVLCHAAEAIGRKLCRPCYLSMRRQNRLDEFPILGPNDVFLGRIKKTSTCWLWTGTKNDYGYGIFLLPGEIPVRAHRFSYEYFVEKIPDGKIIMHSCDNPPCVNPAHLKVATKAENNADTRTKRRHNYGLNHWNGRLSDSDISKILASNLAQAALAKKYNVSQGYISKIKRGEKRK